MTDQDKQEEALIYRILSIVIEENVYPNGNITMINNLDKIAEMYFQKGEYPRAIAYNLKTLIVIKCLCNDQFHSTSACWSKALLLLL